MAFSRSIGLLPTHGRFGAATMLRDARTALDLHRASGERVVRGLARPHIGFAGSEMAHLVGGQLTKGGIRLLDSLKYHVARSNP